MLFVSIGKKLRWLIVVGWWWVDGGREVNADESDDVKRRRISINESSGA